MYCIQTPQTTKHTTHITLRFIPLPSKPQKPQPQNTYVFTDNLNNTYLINNHIHHPSSQHNHPDKLLISTMVHQIPWIKHNITIQKARAHIKFLGNEFIYKLANEGTTCNKPTPTPHSQVAHTILYWLDGIPTSEHQ